MSWPKAVALIVMLPGAFHCSNVSLSKSVIDINVTSVKGHLSEGCCAGPALETTDTQL